MYQCGDNKKMTFCEAASIDIFSFVAFMCLSAPTLPFMTDFRLLLQVKRLRVSL